MERFKKEQKTNKPTSKWVLLREFFGAFFGWVFQLPALVICLRLVSVLFPFFFQNELCKNTVKEGFLHRTFLMREGKKCRKNWTQSYARYIQGQCTSGASGILYFSKGKDEDKVRLSPVIVSLSFVIGILKD